MIPKIIHQIWLQGYDEMPENLKISHQTCLDVNSDFKHIFWTEEKIKRFLKKKFESKYLDSFNYYEKPAQKADFARYSILYIYGGIYLDMDTTCKKNLSNFLHHTFFFTATNDFLNKLYKRYQTGIIGAVPKHGVFKIVFKNMFERIIYANNLTYSTGTRLFYDSINEYKKIYRNHDIIIIDPKYLHPCGVFDNEYCEYLCNDCYIVHTNYSSWTPISRLVKFVIKNVHIILILVVIIIFLIICNRKFEMFGERNHS